MKTIQNCKVHLINKDSFRITDEVWMVLRAISKTGENIRYEAFVKQIATHIGLSSQRWTELKLWYLDEDKDKVRIQIDEDVEMALSMNLDVLNLYIG
ncbi:MAG: hypothetical protein EOP45_15440 [Sphingobacteriaceae bacterium]|nr:MAG: hypothetical protein EOP45_15440 [Sphingobacteriaceae bacterium]